MNAISNFVSDIIFAFAKTVISLTVLVMGIVLIPAVGVVATAVTLVSFILFILFGGIVLKRTLWFWDLVSIKIDKKKKDVEAELVSTPAYNTRKLEELYQEIEKLEKKESEIRRRTSELLQRQGKMPADKKPKTSAQAEENRRKDFPSYGLEDDSSNMVG